MFFMELNKYLKNLGFLCFGAAVLFFNYFLANDYVALLCTIALSIYILVAPEIEIAPTMCFFSSFAYLFRYETLSLYVVVCVFTMARVFLLAGKENLAFVVLICVYLLSHLLCSNLLGVSGGDLFPFFSNLVLFSLCIIPQYIHVKKCNYYFLTGFLLSSFMGMLKSYTRLPDVLKDSLVYYTKFDPLDRFSGITFDSNFYTLLAILSLFILLKIKGTLAIRIPVFILILILGMRTYSKSFYLSLLFCMLFVLFTEWYKSIRVSSVLKYGMIIALVVILGYSLFASYIDVFVYRIQGYNTLDEFTTGRGSLWQMYSDEIFSDPFAFLFGHGIERTIVAAAHNSYLEMLYKFGLFGVLIDVLYLTYCAKKLKVRLKFADIIFYTSIGMLLFNLSAFTFLSMWTCLFLLFINTSTLQDENNLCLKSV